MTPRRTIIALLALALPGVLPAADTPKAPLADYQPWPEEVVGTFENILVQDGGRVKPLHSFSRFTLLQFSGKAKLSFQTEDGVEHEIDNAEWLLDVLFRGEIARQLPTFVVDDSAAVVQIGVSPKSKRDRYSYEEILSGRAKLAELSGEYGEKKRQYEQSEEDPQYELDRIEGMILTLGRNVSSFEYLLGQFGFARKGELLVNEHILPDDLVQLSERIDPVEMLDKMPEMTLDELVQVIRQQSGDSEEERMFSGALRLFFFHANSARGLNIFPPREKENEEWMSAGDVMLAALESRDARPWATEELGRAQTLVQAEKEGPDAFQTALERFSEQQHATAEERGEGAHSGLEVQLYRGQFFQLALVTFIVAFVVLALSWLSPGSRYGRIMVLAACGLAFVGLALDAYGITLRCLIRQRPPITNLYDTIVFITGVAVLLGLLLELFTRIGVGALVAVVSGVLGMFLAMKYEMKEATDTMGQLVAVLDTNFWLATHVTIINIGYAAGMVAALLGILYLGGRFGLMLLGKESKPFFKLLTRMNYGIICFCLFFSLVGTVLAESGRTTAGAASGAGTPRRTAPS